MIIQEIIRQILDRNSTSKGSGPINKILQTALRKVANGLTDCSTKALRIPSFPADLCPAVIPVNTGYGDLNSAQNYSQW
jgi:hypothetical protein